MIPRSVDQEHLLSGLSPTLGHLAMSKFHKLFSGSKGCFYFAHVINSKQKFLTEPTSANIGELIGTITPKNGKYIFRREGDWTSVREFNSLLEAETHVAAIIELGR